MIKTIAAGILLTLTLALQASPTEAQSANSRPADSRPADSRKVFQGTGIVTATEPAGTLTINHQPIAGLMPAMEMMFKANPPTLTAGVHPGDKVEFKVEGKTYVLVGVKVVGHVK